MNYILPRRIQYLLALTLALFILQGTFRLLFWGLISDLPMSFESHLLKAYWIGLRFDLRVSMLAALATLPWLLVPRCSDLPVAAQWAETVGRISTSGYTCRVYYRCWSLLVSK